MSKKKVRTEFGRLLKAYVTDDGGPGYDDLGAALSITYYSMAMHKSRGYLSLKIALRAERVFKGKYKAHLLCKEGLLSKDGELL